MNETTNRDSSELDESEEPEPQEKKDNSMLKKIIIGVVVFVVQAAIAYFLLTQLLLPKLLTSQEQTQDATEKVDDTVKISGAADKKPDSEITAETGIYMIDDLVINPAGSEGKRFLVVSFAFITNTKEGAKELETRAPAVKDGILSLLSRKTIPWLVDTNNREILRREINFVANRLLFNANITKVYFTKYVLQ